MEQLRFFKDGVLARDEVGKILEPHILCIGECVFAGFDALVDWRENNPDHYIQLSPTTCAGIVHDAMVAHAAKVFANMRPDVAVIEALGSKIITFYEQVALRLKKLSSNLEPRNVQTKQQQQFSQHTLWPDFTNVTAGYRLDATRQEIRDVQIVCWYYNELLWNLEIPYTRDDFLDARQVHVVDHPETRIRAKLSSVEKTGTGEK